jgi:hypothetical protein
MSPDHGQAHSEERPARRVAHASVLMLACLLSWGCCDGADAESKAKAADKNPAGIEKTFDRGPVSVRIHVDKKEATIADRLNLTIEARSDEAYETRLPAFGEKLDQFGIVDYTTPQPELLADNQTLRSRTYVLEPFLSGDYVIPPMKVAFWKRDEQDAKRHELETDEIEITINSLLPEDVAGLQMPKPGMAEGSRLWVGLGVLAASLLATAVFLLRRKRQGGPVLVRLPAHEIAYRDLERLIAEDLPGKGEIKQFYQRVSDILRRYIENRFGLHAPEQTTEEFLAALGSDAKLAPGHKSLLKNFLQHCDLVKFAKHEPTTADIQKTFDGCKNFIGETKLVDGPPEAGRGEGART